MRHRPTIGDNAILQAIHATFNIHLHTLTFLPLGEGAWVYRGEDETGAAWFIKLSRTGAVDVERVAIYLHHTLKLAFVLAPIPRSGSEVTWVGDYSLTVYPFLQGEALGGLDLTPYRAEIADDLRMLHEAQLPAHLKAELPHESFDKFQDSARELIGRARSGGSSQLERKLSRGVDQHSAEIDVVLQNAQLMSAYCRRLARTYEFVLCHADIHPFNIMNTPGGLVFLDWEGMMLAPHERDLMFYASDMRAPSNFRRAYGADYELNEYLVTYYVYEWVLQEFSDYIGRIFDDHLSNAARHHALQELDRLFGDEKSLGGVVKQALDSPLP
jgi:thiamine kinase-like enzyme